MHVTAGVAGPVPHYTDSDATIGTIVMFVILVAAVAVFLFVRRR